MQLPEHKPMFTLKKKKAKLWLWSMRLWCWKNHTLSYEQKAAFYPQPKETPWHLTRPYLKQFDHPSIITSGCDPVTRIKFVRYQLLPALIHGHRVNLVHHYVLVNTAEPRLKIWSGHFHCIHCKIMGSELTLQEYSCHEEREASNAPRTASGSRVLHPQSTPGDQASGSPLQHKLEAGKPSIKRLPKRHKNRDASRV